VRRGRAIVVASALVVGGCQADLGARTAPVTDGSAMAGQAILFGRYDGLVRIGEDGPDLDLTIIADDCGASLSGTITTPDGKTAPLVGERLGSALVFDYDAEGFSGQLDGRVITVRALGGTWASDQGQGGTWTALYVEGTVDGHPCPLAETLLEETPR
jgi:hypothetical protein